MMIRMDARRKAQLDEFLARIQVSSFDQWHLLDAALTHSSYANEHQCGHEYCNERLEFLGDAILDMVVGEYLFLHYPHMMEGDLSKARASVVSEAPLADVCRDLNMGQYILLGHGEIKSGGKFRHSILADAFEAVVGALYLGGSYEMARTFILTQLQPYLQRIQNGHYGRDYKTQFQEYIQQDGEHNITYVLCAETGPDHNKTFTMQVCVDGSIRGVGSGKSKKEAEQCAAQAALQKVYVKE